MLLPCMYGSTFPKTDPLDLLLRSLRFGTVLLLAFVSFSLLLNAQPAQNIRGRVVDLDTRTPLPGAKVILTSTEPVQGTYSDSAGYFRLEGIPVGRHSLQCNYIGYEPFMARDLQLTSGKELVLEIPLQEAFVKAETVEITDEGAKDRPLNELATVSARAFSVAETQRYAAALNDPGRMASAFAGVAASPDGRNDIVIRGNSPAGMLWRLEGIDIFNPNHFNNPGSSGGGISIIPTTLLDNSDFMTGAFPAEYGNALSGVFDLNLRKGNDQTHEYTFQVGILGTAIAGEGPFSKEGKKGSYLVNYRYSTLDILKALEIPNLQGTLPSYQDLGFHIDLPTKKAGRFGLFGIGGLSKLNSEAGSDTLDWVYRSDRSQDIFGSDMGAIGLRHLILLPNHKTYIRTSIALTANRNYYEEDTVNTQFDPFRINQQRFIQGKYVFSTVLNHKFNTRHLVRTGTFISRLFYDLDSEGFNFSAGQQQQYLLASGNTWLVQPYVQWRWRIAQRLTLTAGAHGMYLALNRSGVLEPRAGLSWDFAPRQSLGFGYGLHSQILPLGTYFASYPSPDGGIAYPNKQLDFQRAHHFVTSYNVRLTENLRLRLEAYYQRLFNIPIGNANNPTYSLLNQQWGFALDSLVNGGTGRNTGLELTLEKFFSRNYFFLLTGSLFDSRYTAWDGIQRSTRFNGNYACNLIIGKEIHFGKRKKMYFEFSGRLVWLGGQRYTPIDLTASALAGQTVPDESQAFAYQQKDYLRPDIRVAWHVDARRVTHALSFDAQNVTNTQNNFVQRYDPTANAVVQTYEAGLIPVLNYRVDF